MNASDHYLTDRVMTASPAQLTDMLFEAAAAAMRGAARLQDAGDFASALPRSLKAQRILVELRTSLDHGVDDGLTGDLDRLYAWAHGSLVRANSERTSVGTRDALAVVEDLGAAWREACVTATVPTPV